MFTKHALPQYYYGQNLQEDESVNNTSDVGDKSNQNQIKLSKKNRVVPIKDDNTFLACSSFIVEDLHLSEPNLQRIPSPTSSIASNRKLEWDSGADIGYHVYDSLKNSRKSKSFPGLNMDLSSIEYKSDDAGDDNKPTGATEKNSGKHCLFVTKKSRLKETGFAHSTPCESTDKASCDVPDDTRLARNKQKKYIHPPTETASKDECLQTTLVHVSSRSVQTDDSLPPKNVDKMHNKSQQTDTPSSGRNSTSGNSSKSSSFQYIPGSKFASSTNSTKSDALADNKAKYSSEELKSETNKSLKDSNSGKGYKSDDDSSEDLKSGTDRSLKERKSPPRTDESLKAQSNKSSSVSGSLHTSESSNSPLGKIICRQQSKHLITDINKSLDILHKFILSKNYTPETKRHYAKKIVSKIIQNKYAEDKSGRSSTSESEPPRPQMKSSSNMKSEKEEVEDSEEKQKEKTLNNSKIKKDSQSESSYTDSPIFKSPSDLIKVTDQVKPGKYDSKESKERKPAEFDERNLIPEENKKISVHYAAQSELQTDSSYSDSPVFKSPSDLIKVATQARASEYSKQESRHKRPVKYEEEDVILKENKERTSVHGAVQRESSSDSSSQSDSKYFKSPSGILKIDKISRKKTKQQDLIREESKGRKKLIECGVQCELDPSSDSSVSKSTSGYIKTNNVERASPTELNRQHLIQEEDKGGTSVHCTSPSESYSDSSSHFGSRPFISSSDLIKTDDASRKKPKEQDLSREERKERNKFLERGVQCELDSNSNLSPSKSTSGYSKSNVKHKTPFESDVVVSSVVIDKLHLKPSYSGSKFFQSSSDNIKSTSSRTKSISSYITTDVGYIKLLKIQEHGSVQEKDGKSRKVSRSSSTKDQSHLNPSSSGSEMLKNTSGKSKTTGLYSTKSKTFDEQELVQDEEKENKKILVNCGVQCDQSEEKLSDQKSPSTKTHTSETSSRDWRIEQTLSEKLFEARKKHESLPKIESLYQQLCTNQESEKGSYLIQHSKKEKKRQLTWINNEINYLRKLKDMLQTPDTTSDNSNKGSGHNTESRSSHKVKEDKSSTDLEENYYKTFGGPVCSLTDVQQQETSSSSTKELSTDFKKLSKYLTSDQIKSLIKNDAKKVHSSTCECCKQRAASEDSVFCSKPILSPRKSPISSPKKSESSSRSLSPRKPNLSPRRLNLSPKKSRASPKVSNVCTCECCRKMSSYERSFHKKPTVTTTDSNLSHTTSDIAAEGSNVSSIDLNFPPKHSHASLKDSQASMQKNVAARQKPTKKHIHFPSKPDLSAEIHRKDQANTSDDVISSVTSDVNAVSYNSHNYSRKSCVKSRSSKSTVNENESCCKFCQGKKANACVQCTEKLSTNSQMSTQSKELASLSVECSDGTSNVESDQNVRVFYENTTNFTNSQTSEDVNSTSDKTKSDYTSSGETSTKSAKEKKCRKNNANLVRQRIDSKPIAYFLTFEEDSQNGVSSSEKRQKRKKALEKVTVKVPRPARRHTKETNSKKSDYTLQEYLNKNRPDFVQRAEWRRQILNEIADNRPKSLFTCREIKEITQKKYKKLPEVQNKLKNCLIQNQRRHNRCLAYMFSKKLQKKTLQGQLSLATCVSVISPS